MKGSRPEQATLTKNNDQSKRQTTREIIEGMVDGLNDHRIDDIGEAAGELVDAVTELVAEAGIAPLPDDGMPQPAADSG